MSGIEDAGAALLAALTGLNPAGATTPGGASTTPSSGGDSSAKRSSFNISGSSALKAAASKGFKFPKPKFNLNLDEKSESVEGKKGVSFAPPPEKSSSSDRLSEDVAKENVSLLGPFETLTKSPLIQPIAKVKTEFNKADPTNLIAVSSDYICYALKTGDVRVIHSKSAKTALLQGHGGPISDMKFFSKTSNIFGSYSKNGIFILRKIIFKQSLEAIESGTKNGAMISDEIIFKIDSPSGISEDDLVSGQFCFFPTSPKLVVLQRGTYLFVHDTETSASYEPDYDEQPESFSSAGPCVIPHPHRTDIVYVLFARTDGTLYQVEVGNCKSTTEMTSYIANKLRLGVPITSIMPLIMEEKGDIGVIVGSEGNTVFRFLNFKFQMSRKIVFENTAEDTWNQVAYDDETRTLVCCNIGKPSAFHVFRIGSDAGNMFHIDGVRQFTSDGYTSGESFASFAVMTRQSNKDFCMYGVQNTCIVLYKFDMEAFLPKRVGGGKTEGKGKVVPEISPPAPTNASDETSKPKLLTPTQILKSSRSFNGSGDESKGSSSRSASPEKALKTSKGKGESKPKESNPTIQHRSPVLNPLELLTKTVQGTREVDEATASKKEKGSKGKAQATGMRSAQGQDTGGDKDVKVGSIEQSLKKAIQKSKEESLQQMGKLLKASSQSITKDVPLSVQKAVEKEMKSQAPWMAQVVKDTIQENLEEIVKENLNETMRAHMSQFIIPAFENSCREMFRQVHVTMQTFLKNLKIDKENEIKALKDQVQSLTKTVKTTMAKSGSQPSQPIEQKQDVKVEIGRDVQVQKFDDAFCKALITQNVEVVIWLCQQIKEEDFFYLDPFPLSQSVLLALLQQLGSDLNQAKETKLSWIQRVLIVLDTDFFEQELLLDQLLPVLREVQKNLNSAKVKGNERPRFDVVKTVLSSVLYTVEAKMA